MKLVLTNLGSADVPVCSDEGDLAAVIQPGGSPTLDSTDDVWVVGIKAGFVENIKKGIEVVLGVIGALLSRPKEQAADAGVLTFKLENVGEKSVRVIPGTVETEFNLGPGEARDTTAVDYIELRELGA